MKSKPKFAEIRKLREHDRITIGLSGVARAVKPEAMSPQRGAARSIKTIQILSASARAKRERKDRAPEALRRGAERINFSYTLCVRWNQ